MATTSYASQAALLVLGSSLSPETRISEAAILVLTRKNTISKNAQAVLLALGRPFGKRVMTIVDTGVG